MFCAVAVCFKLVMEACIYVCKQSRNVSCTALRYLVHGHAGLARIGVVWCVVCPGGVAEGEEQCTFALDNEVDCCETCSVCTNGQLVAANVAPTCMPAAPGDACATPPGTQPLHAEF